MIKDKFTATWVSHSSISDFLACPRAYFLNNVYRDRKTGHKISLMNAPMALGQAVHAVIESLSIIPVDRRFDESLIAKFEKAWLNVSGKKGGFSSEEQENRYRRRGEEMLRRVMEHPGPLKHLAVKIKQDLPYYWISEEDNIILCGKIDWLEYLPETNSVHIIDFKTSKGEEHHDSLQLPIYHLLVANCQVRPATKASYWYLERNNVAVEQVLPDLKEAHEKVLSVAKEIQLARKLNRFVCPHGLCRACRPLERIIKGEGEFVGVNDFGQDVYVLVNLEETAEVKETKASEIL
ncbi:PD-(D/E)XK nuclease family protein [Candidatus Roizmanbacteria bacterium]|nr:PD-(D/E)XK nuclease family protein [Candidatus Roizmanbacteria bacterium]